MHRIAKFKRHDGLGRLRVDELGRFGEDGPGGCGGNGLGEYGEVGRGVGRGGVLTLTVLSVTRSKLQLKSSEVGEGGLMSSIGTVADVALKSILVAFDFSEASQKPLRHALAVARHYKAKFYLAHVVSNLGYTIAGPEALNLALEKSQREAQELERKLLASGALAGLQYEFLVLEGNVCEQLEGVIQEKQVDLVVVGTHGRGALGKLVLGSTAEQIFRRANCFVDTVGPGPARNRWLRRRQECGRSCSPRILGQRRCMRCRMRFRSLIILGPSCMCCMCCRQHRFLKDFIGQPPGT